MHEACQSRCALRSGVFGNEAASERDPVVAPLRQLKQFLRPLPEFLEKGPQPFHAFGGQQTLDDFHAVVQQIGVGDAELASHRTDAQIARPKDQPPNACVHDGAGAHRTGLHRNVERAAVQTPIFDTFGGGTQRDDLGVGGGVVRLDGTIAAFSQNLIVPND
jgi:hypothetical protein